MLMSVIEGALSAPAYPELAGKRVLITGVTRRLRRRHRARLRRAQGSPRPAVRGGQRRPCRRWPRSWPRPRWRPGSMARSGRARERGAASPRPPCRRSAGSMRSSTWCRWRRRGLDPAATLADVERLIAAQLMLPLLISQIAANRMSLIWSQGLILNVATLGSAAPAAPGGPSPRSPRRPHRHDRAQAEEWAGARHPLQCHGDRRPRRRNPAPPLGEPDVASLALYLASARGRALSGCVFEAS